MPSVPAAAVTLHVPYQGPAVLSYQGPSDCSDPVRSVGIACVSLSPQSHAVDLLVKDASGLAVGGSYYTHDASGNTLAIGLFCHAASIPLTGAESLIVIRLEGINGPAECLNEGKLGTLPATKGMLAVRLR